VLRDRLNAAFKDANEAGDQRAASTLRLILAAIKERDHCSREAGAGGNGSGGGEGEDRGVGEEEISAMLAAMVDQRRREIRRCEECARLEMAEQEAEEIRVIERFLPARMSEADIEAAVDEAISGAGASRLKDAGRVIAALKERYNGRMDFACAKRLLCARLH
jgi:uncharacterized protein YqeY